MPLVVARVRHSTRTYLMVRVANVVVLFVEAASDTSASLRHLDPSNDWAMRYDEQ